MVDESLHTRRRTLGARSHAHAAGIRRGLYGEGLSAFKAVSEDLRFGYDEGLPGKAWASGHPVILTKFANS
ncbi:hypothetical protein [Bradyrhizobium sp. DOA1]|uniref:hypothetical protein n=1 Tax=Bradyrhizobium sp. DOA1 TaxID=1126616 RepID=UPI000AC04839|nr:hypothetical protein [Bradyrhizobium sp. DOA1]